MCSNSKTNTANDRINFVYCFIAQIKASMASSEIERQFQHKHAITMAAFNTKSKRKKERTIQSQTNIFAIKC